MRFDIYELISIERPPSYIEWLKERRTNVLVFV